MRVRTIFHLWLPLAVSFELMMLEGPAIHGAIGRLAEAPLHLAAWGLTMSLSLIIESPVIMLLSTAIALVKDGQSYLALRRFVLTLLVGCTVLSGLVAFTPLMDWVSVGLMGQPVPIVNAARPAMQIMLLWTAAIAWRRFLQGILIRHGYTRLVSWGTAVRLLATVVTAVALVLWGKLPGVQVGAITIMAGVVSEALMTTLFALPRVRRQILPLQDSDAPPLTQSDILRFHTPLAATTLLTLLAQPITSAALAHLAFPTQTLAAWPVAYMVLLVMRGWGLALQEITVAQARSPETRPALQKFTWLVGGATTGATALLAGTPLLGLYMQHTLNLPPELHGYVRIAVGVGVLLPMITALGSWARGVLVAGGDTKTVYRGMALNLAAHGGLLTLGVLLRLPGMWVAAIAFTASAIAEYVYLARRAVAIFATAPPPRALATETTG